MATGWTCPSCGRAWAPHVDACRECGPHVVQEAAPEPTFATLWNNHYSKWCERHQAASWRSARHGHGEHLLAHFGPLPWDQIASRHLDAYCDKRLKAQGKVSGRPIQPATVNLEIASAKRCINHCLSPAGGRVIQGVNPFLRYPELPVTSQRRFHLSETEFVRLLEEARPLLRLMLVFAFETGMRRDEFRCLEWSEVDVVRGVVRLPPERTKTRKARDVPLSDVALAVLRSVPRFARSTYVFENPKGNNKPVPETTLYTWFCGARKASGVKGPKDQAVWVHTLRKSFGTIMAMSGMPIYMLMEIMGHTDPDIHFEYVKMSPEHHQRAREQLNRRIGPQPAPPAEGEQSPPALSPLLQFVRRDS